MQEISASLNLSLTDEEVKKIEIYMQIEAIAGKPLSFNQALSELLSVGLKRQIKLIKIALSSNPDIRKDLSERIGAATGEPVEKREEIGNV